MIFSHKFEGIGTHWNIDIDTTESTDLNNLWILIEQEVSNFNSKFSRFREDSLVNLFKNSPAGEYQIDSELYSLLSFAKDLKEITYGKFDPAIGQLISDTGYNASYTFKPDQQKINHFTSPNWNLSPNNILTIDGPVAFDLGGFAKGYLIDKISKLILDNDHRFHLVDAGGDIYATTKSDNSPWKVAVEFPGDRAKALGVVSLNHQALAVSDIFKRNWGTWHHIVDPVTKKPLTTIISCSTLAKRAMTADALTTALMLTDDKTRQTLTQTYKTEFLLITDKYTPIVSNNWPSDFF